jgi:hypothetical protein
VILKYIGIATDIYYQQRFSVGVLEPLLIMNISSGELLLITLDYLQQFRNRNWW